MESATVMPVPYKNTSGEAVPSYAVVEVMNTTDVVGGNGVHSVNVRKSTGVGRYGIDLGKGSGSAGDSAYGQFGFALMRPMWVKYNGSVAPTGTTVGPVSGQWYMDETGTGFTYLGAFNETAGLILVIEKISASGGAQEIQFELTAIDCDAGTFTAQVTDVICNGAEEAIGDSVSLEDPLGLLTGCSALMIGHVGFATKMSADGPYGAPCTYKITAMDTLETNCG